MKVRFFEHYLDQFDFTHKIRTIDIVPEGNNFEIILDNGKVLNFDFYATFSATKYELSLILSDLNGYREMCVNLYGDNKRLREELIKDSEIKRG